MFSEISLADMDFEQELYEQAKRIGRLEGKLEDLKDNLKESIQAGDEHTRYGVETTRASLVKLDEKLSDIASSILGPEGKKAIWSELEQLGEGVEFIKDDFNTFVDDFSEHLTKHASVEGKEEGKKSVTEQIKKGWVQPVITATLVGILLILIRFVLGVGG